MKNKCLVALFLGMVFTVSASAQVSVYVGITPPPIPYEAPPPPSAVGMIWVSGFWVPQGHHYRWVATLRATTLPGRILVSSTLRPLSRRVAIR
jgi:hypothetical protein